MEERIHSFLESVPCQSDMPFPPVKVEKQNCDYARMLFEAYASSQDSEIQAVTQYLYHSKTIKNKKVSNAIMCISLVEMHHLDVLSELVTMLGAKPIYYNSNENFWMTGNIAYVDKGGCHEKDGEGMKDDRENIRLKLQSDIRGEQNAINGYRALLQNIKDKHVEKIILKIISDEQVHLKIFESLLGEFS